MDNKEINNFMKSAKKIVLTNQEKETCRSKILQHIKKPVRKNERVSLWSMFHFNRLTAGLVTGALILTFTGTAFAANSSQPGSLLYPIKLNVNEKIKSQLLFDNYQKAKYSIEKVQKRLEETEKAKLNKELKPEIQSMLQAEFVKNSTETQTLVETLKKENRINEAGDVSDQLEFTLKAHETIFGHMKSNEDDEKLINTIKKQRQNSRKQQDKLQKNAANLDNEKNSAENEVRNLEKQVQLSKQTPPAFQDKINQTKGLIHEGKKRMEQKSDGALELFRKAKQDSGELNTILKTSKQLNIEPKLPEVETEQEDD